MESPSISTKSWFNVFSCSEWPLAPFKPRFLPTASISSKKEIEINKKYDWNGNYYGENNKYQWKECMVNSFLPLRTYL